MGVYLANLRQVRVDEISGVFGVPVLLVSLHLLLQEVGDCAVVGVDGVMRSWQITEEAGEGIVQLVEG